MKKRLIILLIPIILLCGCKDEKITKEKELYDNYIKELKEVNDSSTDYPFKIEIKYDKLVDGIYRYQVIIDETEEDIYDIEAIAIHNKKTKDIYPSIGIFDKKEKLEVGKKPAGIILVGYIDYDKKIEDFNCKIKVLIKYKNKNNNKKSVYYVTK